MGETIGVGVRFVLLAFGLLADRPQIDQFSHQLPPLDGTWIHYGSGLNLCSNITVNCAKTLARFGSIKVIPF